MSLIVKLIISLVIATIAYTLSSLMATGTVALGSEQYGLLLLLAFFIATTATALLVRDSEQAAGSASGPRKDASGTRNDASGAREDNSHTSTAPAHDGIRERGQVKWFNVSKGFGFIIRDDGEEIFVHFRSIRGEGRRALRDGQSVSFVVEQSDKGPQAEDVVAED